MIGFKGPNTILSRMRGERVWRFRVLGLRGSRFQGFKGLRFGVLGC